MGKKSFSMVEILIVLIIVGVLAALTLVSYQKTIEATNDKICKQNLKVLQAAIDVYALENNTLPVTISQLNPRHIHLAYEKVFAGSGENRLLAYVGSILWAKPALAQSLKSYYGGDSKTLLCPADPNYKAKLAEIKAGTFDDNDSSYNFRKDDYVFKDGKLKKNSVYAIFSDKSSWHKDNFFGTVKHANGVTPRKIKGKMYDGMVKKAKEKDSNWNGELESNECDEDCLKELEKDG